MTSEIPPNEPVTSFVLPIVKVRPGKEHDTLEFVALLGTCFLLADSGGLAMTARHVAKEIVIGETAVLFNRNGEWELAGVQGVETHPVEDVALIRLEPGDYHSPFKLSHFHAHASSQYMVWGYPDAILRELPPGRDSMTLPRQDLAYSEGHIRRRLTDIPLVNGPLGAKFYELSVIAGNGCSGGPVTLHSPNMQWSVVGVYVGERRSPAVADKGRIVQSEYLVGFATRTEDLDDRFPKWSALYE
ncbi:MAG: trypsin-like peptidase domain-containing protein [Pseudonocardiaceae bacterium]